MTQDYGNIFMQNAGAPPTTEDVGLVVHTLDARFREKVRRDGRQEARREAIIYGALVEAGIRDMEQDLQENTVELYDPSEQAITAADAMSLPLPSPWAWYERALGHTIKALLPTRRKMAAAVFTVGVLFGKGILSPVDLVPDQVAAYAQQVLQYQPVLADLTTPSLEDALQKNEPHWKQWRLKPSSNTRT